LQQHLEYLKRLILKPNPDTILAEFASPEIELEGTETDKGTFREALAGAKTIAMLHTAPGQA
jgi:hypothetical protein